MIQYLWLVISFNPNSIRVQYLLIVLGWGGGGRGGLNIPCLFFAYLVHTKTKINPFQADLYVLNMFPLKTYLGYCKKRNKLGKTHGF